MNRLAITSVVASQLALSCAASAQENPEARVDALFAEIDRSGGPGLAVAVVRDGEVLLRKGYGLASLEHRVPITPSTVFDVASVSKQFTGLAVAMLVEQGRIDLDDDIREYIPELPDFGRTITIDHLLHHTSGLRDWPATLAVAGWRMDDVISFDQILTMAYHQESLNFEPGAEYTYSNTGYNLLAELVAPSAVGRSASGRTNISSVHSAWRAHTSGTITTRRSSIERTAMSGKVMTGTGACRTTSPRWARAHFSAAWTI